MGFHFIRQKVYVTYVEYAYICTRLVGDLMLTNTRYHIRYAPFETYSIIFNLNIIQFK